MDYFDFDMQLPTNALPAGLSRDSAEGPRVTEKTPVGTPMERPQAMADRPITIDVSTTFQPDLLVDGRTPDLVLVSSDRIYFYTHSHRLLAASHNAVGGMLASMSFPDLDGSPPTVPVPAPADVLNIVVHAIYGLPAVQFMPTLETVADALAALTAYGVLLAPLVTSRDAPLSALILAHAPLRPIEAYALVAQHGLPTLAAPISAHLLAYPLVGLSDALAQQMGPIYLKRLFFLHKGRTETLKRLLLPPPPSHEPTNECEAGQQQRRTRAWALASAHLMWDVGPNISTSMLQTPLLHLERELSCPLCKQALRDRVAALISEWAAVKRTI